MSSSSSTLIGSVFERMPTSHSPRPVTTPKSGFPAVQHRSKSAFARNLEESRRQSASRLNQVPTVAPIRQARTSKFVNSDEWRIQMSHENEERVASMTEEEREQERREILERFGAEIGDVLKRVKHAREVQVKPSETPAQSASHDHPINIGPVPITAKERFERESASRRPHSPPSSVLSTSSTRPSSRADRKLRFAELAPEDVHVYESAPPSPRRKVLALPSPSYNGSEISLGQFHGTLATSPVPPTIEPEEGSAEFIRQRYFPDAPTNNSNLAWMQPSSSSNDASISLRFDLSGRPIPPDISSTLPTHLGLHHHAEGTHAGYSLDDIFLLSRSTVPAQRATMLGVLAHIVKWVSNSRHEGSVKIEEFIGKEEDLRRRVVASGIEAMMERGSVGARAVEVIWECVVGWDEDLLTLSGVEVGNPTDATINSLQLDFFLPQVSTLFAQGEILEDTRSRLLSILYRLSQHSLEFANAIVTTPKLVGNVIQAFLLTPIPPTETSSLPNAFALEFLICLASASRTNAITLREFADALLRFTTFLPSSSLFQPALTTQLLTLTLRFFTVLASYGLYSHVATTAQEQFVKLNGYILSDACTTSTLQVAWADLQTAWTVCAVDPHQTTPGHGILWSQIIGWGWNSEMDNLSDQLTAEEKDWPVWAAIWRHHAAYLEGARINSMRGGSSERMECLDVIRSGFEDGREKKIVTSCLEIMRHDLANLQDLTARKEHVLQLHSLTAHAATLSAAIRLWLACLPPISDGPLEYPPFPLPFRQLSELSASITTHSIWSCLSFSKNGTPNHAYVHMRALSELLSVYLRLSRRLPDISKELWVAQALSYISRFLPGDEEFALQVVDETLNLVTPEWLNHLGIQVSPAIWEGGGMSVLKPFVTYTVRPQATWIGPTFPTPQSISKSTTQWLPSIAALENCGLPVARDWALTPLDHLLRSGTSEVFKSLPADWDSSEVEVVRNSFLLATVCYDVLTRFTLMDYALTREEAVFGCMKVFMLEHGQVQTDSTEVFRDKLVGFLMEDLLRPYVNSSKLPHPPRSPMKPSGDLEKVATNFLRSTPFYQYYTDFVALYDAISFSHPLFASLLLPPTSMRYPLDYRKYLWNDFGHIIKTIRTPVDHVICDDIGEYLWPVEKDPEMIGFYVRALLKQQVQEFVRLLAVHHVSCNIWQDLSTGSEWEEDRARKLLRAIAIQGGNELITEVVRYRQSSRGPSLVPPDCFEQSDGQVSASRLDYITLWGLQDRLQGLL